MKWKRIPKEESKQPPKGKYSDWKQLLADEGFNQCVYCAIHESSFGGIRNYHVEHYRPKSKFEALENDIKNLFYACAICNTFKSDDWPEEPCKDYSNVSYPYPGEVDYSDIFITNSSPGVIKGKYVASKYMVQKLFLNRPQLIIERRIYYTLLSLEYLTEFFRDTIPVLEKSTDGKAQAFLAKIAKCFIEITSLQKKLRKLVPYRDSDAKR